MEPRYLGTKKESLPFIFRKEILVLLFIYIPLLIPFTLALIYIGIKVDNLLMLPQVIFYPFNLFCSSLFFILGLIIVLWSYKYLVYEGKGSPCSYAGHTQKLVKNGPYSLVRHPSIIGKFLGIIGLGLLSKSFSFTFIIAPLLLIGSLIDKILREEKILARLFKEEYIDYKKNVPFIIPKVKDILGVFTKNVKNSILTKIMV